MACTGMISMLSTEHPSIDSDHLLYEIGQHGALFTAQVSCGCMSN